MARQRATEEGLVYVPRLLSEDAEPIPERILPVRAAAAALAGLEPGRLVEVLLQRYPEGAQIGWHRDAATFGTVVRGLAARPVLSALPARPPRRAPCVRARAGTAFRLRARRTGAHVLAAPHPADEEPALLDHIRTLRP